MKVLPVDLRLVPLDAEMRDSLTPSALTGGRCLGCGAPLVWHQPDSDDPNRMLGVCAHCGGWHLLDIRFEAREAVFMLLPDSRKLHPPGPIPTDAVEQVAAGSSAPDKAVAAGAGAIRVAFITSIG